MKTSINKVNPIVLLVYFALPIVAGIIAAFAIVNPNAEHTADSRLVMFVFVAIIGFMVVFLAVAPILFSTGKKRLLRACKESGCNNDYFFYGTSALVAVDTQSRQLGILFKFNPFTPFVVSLNETSNAKTNNGCSVLSLGGTREVTFSFLISGKKVTVCTFRANSTFSMKSKEVIEAIAKADRMVAAINGEDYTDEAIAN